MSDLARRLAAHPKWEWREGMRMELGRIVRIVKDEFEPWCVYAGEKLGTGLSRTYLDGEAPDLTDGPTIGALLDMLREATGWPRFGSVLVGGLVVAAASDATTETLGEIVARKLLKAWGEDE